MTVPIIAGIVLAVILYIVGNAVKLGKVGRIVLFVVGLVVGFFGGGIIQAMLQ